MHGWTQLTTADTADDAAIPISFKNIPVSSVAADKDSTIRYYFHSMGERLSSKLVRTNMRTRPGILLLYKGRFALIVEYYSAGAGWCCLGNGRLQSLVKTSQLINIVSSFGPVRLPQ